jgi:hypothetical protein
MFFTVKSIVLIEVQAKTRGTGKLEFEGVWTIRSRLEFLFGPVRLRSQSHTCTHSRQWLLRCFEMLFHQIISALPTGG